ncbi:MAG: hypothetical protein KAI99_17920, partial [Cyclobacteriaceae bacterium]|nr:hypothetical protein [Cyclobacteriaceae bacterium]
ILSIHSIFCKKNTPAWPVGRNIRSKNLRTPCFTRQQLLPLFGMIFNCTIPKRKKHASCETLLLMNISHLEISPSIDEAGLPCQLVSICLNKHLIIRGFVPNPRACQPKGGIYWMTAIL